MAVKLRAYHLNLDVTPKTIFRWQIRYMGSVGFLVVSSSRYRVWVVQTPTCTIWTCTNKNVRKGCSPAPSTSWQPSWVCRVRDWGWGGGGVGWGFGWGEGFGWLERTLRPLTMGPKWTMLWGSSDRSPGVPHTHTCAHVCQSRIQGG